MSEEKNNEKETVMDTTGLVSFIKEVKARIKGDSVEVDAIKIGRKARAAVKSQLSALEGKEVEAEEALSDAQERLAETKFPTTWEHGGNPNGYCEKLLRAYEVVVSKKDELEDIQKSKEFFEELLKSFK